MPRMRSVPVLATCLLIVCAVAACSPESTTTAAPSAVAAQPQPKADNPPASRLVDQLRTKDAAYYQGVDLALINLVCAEGLAGSEHLDVGACLKTLGQWVNHVGDETDRNLHLFAQHPQEYKNSLAYFRMLMLVTVLQQDFGVIYNPARRTPDWPFTDSADVFLHGMLVRGGAGGTCASMPTLYFLVARKLGYPVHLVHTKAHFFCRWDGSYQLEPSARFNIEGAGTGMNDFADDYYRHWPMEVTAEEERMGRYLVNLSDAEIAAAYWSLRAACLADTEQPIEAVQCYELASRLSNGNPEYSTATRVIGEAYARRQTRRDIDAMRPRLNDPIEELRRSQFQPLSEPQIPPRPQPPDYSPNQGP